MTKKKTRAELLAALNQLQQILGIVGGAFLNDRREDRAEVINKWTQVGLDIAVDAQSTDPPRTAKLPS
jgi:hypothetical protein